MSIEYGKDGQIVLHLTNGNVRGIAELVKQRFEDVLAQKELHSEGSPRDLRNQAWDEIIADIKGLSQLIHDSSCHALKTSPQSPSRHDLLGRMLMFPLEPHMSNDPTDKDGFPRQFIAPVLEIMKKIIGEDRYKNINDFSVKPSLDFCIVHDLQRSVIDWDEFYNQSLISLLRTRVRNALKRWLDEGEHRPELFMSMVNESLSEDSGVRPFGATDWALLQRCWKKE